MRPLDRRSKRHRPSGVDFRPRCGVRSPDLRLSADLYPSQVPSPTPIRRQQMTRTRAPHPEPGRATARRARVQAGTQPELERLPELRDLVHDHLDPGGLLHHLRPGVEQRRPGRDLVGLAAHLDPDPDDRLLHVGARLGVSDGRRHLLVGIEARRSCVGLVHRLVQPDRPGGRPRIGRLRLRDVHEHSFSASTTSTLLRASAKDPHDFLRGTFFLFLAHPRAARGHEHPQLHLVAIFNSISVWWHVAGVALILGVLIFVPAHHASVDFVFTDRITTLASRTGCSGSTCCRSGSC